MTEENKIAQSVGVNEETETLDTNSQYINTINDLNTKIKTEMVSRDSYNQLKKENQQLLNSLVNGTDYGVEGFSPDKKTKMSKEELYEGLHSNNQIKYWTTALKYRDEQIAKGQKDPFATKSQYVETSQAEYECAENVANTIKQALEEADGDSIRFNSILRSIIK